MFKPSILITCLLFSLLCFADSGYQKPEKLVALTFDDGPNKTATPKILNILIKNNVHATFFIVGKNATKLNNIVGDLSNGEQEIASHSYSHKKLTKINNEDLRDDLILANNVIERTTNKRVRWFRPPYGMINNRLRSLVSELGMECITWTIDPQDWRGISPKKIVSNIVRNIHSGGIILLHDRSNTAAALPEIIKRLQSMGYKFVTMSELSDKSAIRKKLLFPVM